MTLSLACPMMPTLSSVSSHYLLIIWCIFQAALKEFCRSLCPYITWKTLSVRYDSYLVGHSLLFGTPLMALIALRDSLDGTHCSSGLPWWHTLLFGTPLMALIALRDSLMALIALRDSLDGTHCTSGLSWWHLLLFGTPLMTIIALRDSLMMALIALRDSLNGTQCSAGLPWLGEYLRLPISQIRPCAHCDRLKDQDLILKIVWF